MAKDRRAFAKRVFTGAAIYGLIALLPQYFLEERIGQDFPPPITHPEQFYGFIGVAVAWQLAFLLIARDAVRYRLLMLPAVVEKLAFAIPVAALFAQGRVGVPVLIVGTIDFVLSLLFLTSFLVTPAE